MPNGPRADSNYTNLMKNDITNLILLCPECHKLIDDNPNKYTKEMLIEMKQNRESNIQRAINMAGNKQAHVVLYRAPIGKKLPTIDENKISEAIWGKWFPAQKNPINLNPNNSSISDDENLYWQNELRQLELNYSNKIKPLLENNEIKTILLFGIAPQPLLVKLGSIFNDIYQVEVYQKHREPNSWKWEEDNLIKDNYEITTTNDNYENIVLNLSLSCSIDNERIYSVLGRNTTIYTLSHQNSNNDYIKCKSQLIELRKIFRLLFDKIKSETNQKAVLHVFMACPVSAAIEFGRVWMPKADLQSKLYDQNKKNNEFEYSICLKD